MTEDYFAILPPGVLHSVEQMRQTGAAIQAAFKDLSRDGDAVITGSWTGAAANAIDKPWQEWETDFAKHLGRLEDGPDVLAVAAHQFKSIDGQGGN